MKKFLDYLVTTLDGRFSLEDYKKMEKNLKETNENVESIEVESFYFRERAIIFSDTKVTEEEALNWFEEEQEKFYKGE